MTSTVVSSNKASAGSDNSNRNFGRQSNFLLASTAALLAACSLNFVAVKSSASPSINTTTTAQTTSKGTTGIGDGGSDGGGGGENGGSSTDTTIATTTATSSKEKSVEDMKSYEESIANNPYQVSLIFIFILSFFMDDTMTILTARDLGLRKI